ncbi:MAG: alkaline phosphatase family protein [Candidatus Omnitrophica bacterium]|nr:alkaline phosphatase family protein [Candidatus Omnitrophota bacterium]
MFLAYIDPGSGFTIFGLGAWLIAFMLGFFGIFLLFFKKIVNFFRKHKVIFCVILIIIVALILILNKENIYKEKSMFDKKIIILGFDGLSPDIIEPMMDRGELPNFSHLKEAGSYRRLSTTNPPQSPVAWAGFATGKNPGKNGIYDFIVRNPKDYSLRLSTADIEGGKARPVVKTKSFWNYTSEAGVPTNIITCPVTFPADKVKGKMLSGMGTPDILGTEGTFTFYTTGPIDKEKDTGGKVFEVQRSPEMTLDLIGPKVKGIGAKPENAKVPFKVSLRGRKSITIRYNGKDFELKVGKWSDWQEVTFNLGLLKKTKGIFKFYLVETEPEFKLYVSPINMDPRDPYFPISYPGQYSKELTEKIGLYYTQGAPMDTWALNEKRLTEDAFLEQANEVLNEKKAMLDLGLAESEKGVLFCYFESPDIIQHMFWRYTDQGHPLYERGAGREYKEMIAAWYKKMDNILGEVMQKAGSEDTLIVLSDHGFNTFRRAAHINTWLRANGYLQLKNPYAESGKEMLEDIDWAKTKAYAIGFGAIYINQKGREGQGIVAPGEETEQLKKEIAEKLEGWVDKQNNRPVVNKAYLREDIFKGDYVGEAPDLYIGFKIGYRASWQTALGAVPKELMEDNLKKWSGTHLIDPTLIPGIIFSNKRITKEDPSIYDIAPTVLKITGYDDEEIKKLDMDGETLF